MFLTKEYCDCYLCDMVLRNKYLHAYSFLPAIPRGRLLMGVFVGLLFASCFYAFLYICREALRILFFMTEDYDVLVLSDATMYFYNFILAYIATVLGQSLCFICWFEIPLRKLGKYASQMRTVINDQRSMNFYFLSWFSRLAYVFVLLIGGTMGGGIYVIRTFSDYKYILILVILVLFLHTWLTIRRLFNGKSFRWMLVSAIFLSVFSFGLSRINLIDYKRINEIILSKNINYTHLLQLPEAVCFERMNSENRRRATLWIAENKDKFTDADPVIFIKHFGRYEAYNGEQIPFDSLKEYFYRWDQDTWEETKYEPCVLYIHRDIKMNYVNRIKKCLAELQAYRIQYAVLPSVREYDDRYYTYLAFPLVTSRYFAEAEGWQELQKVSSIPKYVHDLYTTATGEILFNGTKVQFDDFKDFIQHKIQVMPDYCIKYYIHNNSTYAEYIFIVSTIMQAIHELRNDYSFEVYQRTYGNLEWDETKVIRERLPYRVVEIPIE